LDKKNYIYCRVGESPLGPKRKYYRITDKGRKYLASFIQGYQEMTRRADQILFYEKQEAGDEHGEL
jgi:PadR family transcriptional regulator PadR